MLHALLQDHLSRGQRRNCRNSFNGLYCLLITSRSTRAMPDPCRATRLHGIRSPRWLLYLSAVPGRPAAHQQCGSHNALSQAEADGSTSLTADCVENASAFPGAAGPRPLWRNPAPMSRHPAGSGPFSCRARFVVPLVVVLVLGQGRCSLLVARIGPEWKR